jgi:hypothetical protein
VAGWDESMMYSWRSDSPAGNADVWCCNPPSTEWRAPPSGDISWPEGARRDKNTAVMTNSVLGVDLGKDTCSVVGLDAAGMVVLRRRVKKRP